MKFSKKTLSAIIVSTLLATSLVGCSSETSEPTQNDNPNTSEQTELVPEEGASLVVWEGRGKDAEAIRKIAEKFTEKYNIPVKVEEVEGPDQVGKLTQDGPAGLAADVLGFPHNLIGGAVTANLILPNDFYAEQTKEEFLENAVNAVSFNGAIYGYPKSVETYGLFYNKDLVKEVPKTFDEIIAYAKEHTDVKKKKYGFMWDIGNFYFTYAFLAGYGGYVFKDGTDPSDIGLNNEGAVEGAKFYQSLKQILPLNTTDVNGDIMTSLFESGDLAMSIDGPWRVGGFKEKGVNFGVAPLPTLPNGEHMKSFSGVRAWYVNAYTKYPNAAKLFARFATSKEMLEMAYDITGNIPARKDTQDLVANNEYSKAFLEQFNYSSPMPSIPQMDSVWEPGGAAIATIWNEGTDPKKALDDAVNKIKTAIGQ